MQSVLILFLFFNLFVTDHTDDKKAILFFGDSITAGYGIGTEYAFPYLIEAKLLEEGYKVEVVNGGLSGETSAGGLSRIDWMLNRRYDVFVLELGANDGLRGLPLTETKKNLQLIIDKVKGKFPETKILIAGMMVPPNMGEAYANEFQRVFQEVAKNNNAELIPFLLEDVGGIEELNQADGIHPNQEGHQIIARNIYSTIVALL